MESRTSLSEALRTLFFEEAPRLAKEQQVIKRQRCFSASSLLLVFVLGWLQHPLAGPSQLARFAHLVGVRVSKQAIAERLTEQTAQWLHRVLEHAVRIVLLASPLTTGLLARFPAVILEDASSIELPGALACLWKGCGGNASASSIKLGVRWDVRSGQLQGPFLQDGKSHETRHAVHDLALPVGSVWVASLPDTFFRSMRAPLGWKNASPLSCDEKANNWPDEERVALAACTWFEPAETADRAVPNGRALYRVDPPDQNASDVHVPYTPSLNARPTRQPERAPSSDDADG